MEDQEDLSGADVSRFMPLIGIYGEFDLYNIDKYRIAATIGANHSSYDYFQTYNNGTTVDGKVNVLGIFTGIGASFDSQGRKVSPYVEAGLNTVFNGSDIEIKRPRTTEIENEKRKHTGLTILLGTGLEFPVTNKLNINLGAKYNAGGADTYGSIGGGVNIRL